MWLFLCGEVLPTASRKDEVISKKAELRLRLFFEVRGREERGCFNVFFLKNEQILLKKVVILQPYR